jgi:hypothetical protein
MALLGFESRLFQPKHLMLKGFKIDNHGPLPRCRCHIEMVAVSAKASVAMTMNVRPERIRLEELP